MVANTQMKKSPFKFIVFVYILSIPFWIIGALTKSTGALTRVNIPVSALMAVCPVIAALIFTFREEGSGGAKRLLARILDYKRIDRKIWYLPIFLLMPVVAILAYVVMRVAGSSGKGGALQRRPPLRTVLAGFLAHGSSKPLGQGG